MLLDILSRIILLLMLSALLVSANVEKVIFLGPEPVNPETKPSLSALQLHTLTPGKPSVRTNLTRVFASETAPLGQSTWLLLDQLTAGQRYELRVCWAAIEPTSFTLDVYELNSVWETPELMQSLAAYSYSVQPKEPVEGMVPGAPEPADADHDEPKSSVLLLHVQAAADYFADDVVLMHSPPPVLVDLILDPFLFNIVPLSLIPTAGYLVLVAIVSWFVARRIANWLQSIAQSSELHDKKNT
ncbi:hypothetical protein S40285_02187 [Stachybotrys chlorohalonatus IBT 40285]|uniref:Uncharacterized protein n=1 Tax=Stachybotrys chlorohalonatus (strain IBT 40285) TaxID=1283841 RepID=A0A084QAY9_STAC4|nr:hypothetical protein S40285_02187 [Stachybotrys chlorohalonata IBT 40285]